MKKSQRRRKLEAARRHTNTARTAKLDAFALAQEKASKARKKENKSVAFQMKQLGYVLLPLKSEHKSSSYVKAPKPRAKQAVEKQTTGRQFVEKD